MSSPVDAAGVLSTLSWFWALTSSASSIPGADNLNAAMGGPGPGNGGACIGDDSLSSWCALTKVAPSIATAFAGSNNYKSSRDDFSGGGGGDGDAQIAGKGGIGSGRNNRGNSDMGFDLVRQIQINSPWLILSLLDKLNAFAPIYGAIVN